MFRRILFFLMLLGLLLESCTPKGPTQAEYDALKTSFDSLTDVQQSYNQIVDEINTSIDSIAVQEGLIFLNNEDGKNPTKQQILERLDAYKQLLARQHEQLEQLTSENKHNSQSVNKLNRIINELRAQMTEKEHRILELEEELQKSSRNIADLKNTITTITEEVKSVTEEKNELQQVASVQDKMLNSGYFIVGTKSELKELGLLVGGLFSKKKANYANMDKSKFTEVDIREFSEINIQGKKPKLITEKPADTFTIVTNSDGTSTLRITDATRFWQSSPFLVIQSK